MTVSKTMHLLAIADLSPADAGEYALLLPNGKISSIKISLTGANESGNLICMLCFPMFMSLSGAEEEISFAYTITKVLLRCK